jgi:hypothetical protein
MGYFVDFFVLSFFVVIVWNFFFWLVGTKAHSPAAPLHVKFIN